VPEGLSQAAPDPQRVRPPAERGHGVRAGLPDRPAAGPPRGPASHPRKLRRCVVSCSRGKTAQEIDNQFLSFFFIFFLL